MIETQAAYQALTTRDPRFDGIFYVGVTSTRIYCRPICPAKTPTARNCRFFQTAGQAEKAGFRPCLRCRPELAPGAAPVDDAQRIAHLIAQRIETGDIGLGANLAQIAGQFELSPRQIRRIMQAQLGLSPMELLQSKRLLLAKQLLTETSLPVTQIAFASGFSSLRRFNDAFSRHYRMPPSRLRREAATPSPGTAAETCAQLRLAYRPPYDWPGVLAFLAGRMIKGVEHVTPTFYARTVRLGFYVGWVKVTQRAQSDELLVEFPPSLTAVLPALLGRLRDLFDLDARPDIISGQLMRDATLAPIVARNPGLRVPGAFDGHEMAMRAILGQQITVKAATTLAGRLAARFGTPVATPFEALNLLAPTPKALSEATIDDIAALGIIRNRAASLIALSRAIASGGLDLRSGLPAEKTIAALRALPGIGPWTAQYIAMRALHWPDAFPREDIAIRKQFGRQAWKQIEAAAEAWRPWRGYATLHIWSHPEMIAPAAAKPVFKKRGDELGAF